MKTYMVNKINRKPETATGHSCKTQARVYRGNTNYFLAAMDNLAKQDLCNQEYGVKLAPAGSYEGTEDGTTVIILADGGDVYPAPKFVAPYATPAEAMLANPDGRHICYAPAGGWLCTDSPRFKVDIDGKEIDWETGFFTIGERHLDDPSWLEGQNKKYEAKCLAARLPVFCASGADPWKANHRRCQ